MQSGLIETPTHDFHPNNPRHTTTTTAQHGSGRSRSSLPDACSPPPARSSVLSGAQPADGAPAAAFVCHLDVDHLDHTLGRLSLVDAGPAAAARVTQLSVAGQRISEYENAIAASSSPRTDPRPPLGFKVTPNSRSDGVQLVDFPNGSCLASSWRAAAAGH